MAEHGTQTATRQIGQKAANAPPVSETAARQNLRPDDCLYELQKALGNQVLQRSLLTRETGIPRLQRKCTSCEHGSDDDTAGMVQTKLTVNQPGDVFEQEADRVASAVMSMPENSGIEQSQGPVGAPLPGIQPAIQRGIQRACPECQQELQRAPENPETASCGCASHSNTDPEPENNLQAKEVPGRTPEITATTAREILALRGAGQSLPNRERSFFESKFGYDFSGVRVHNGDQAARSARQIQSLAYTTGSNIVFGAGQYHPGSTAGRHLIAHELAHVVQQSSGNLRRSSANQLQRSPKPQVGTAPPAVQRMGDPAQAPKTMACPISTSSSAFPIDTSVLFGLQAAQLSPKSVADIAGFAARWNSAGADRLVRVDGFASTDGPQPLNWTLSCQRAQAVGSELNAPSGGSPGVPANFIDVFAQGETSEFSTALEPNRRATISADLSAPPPPTCANPGVARDLDVQPVFLRTSPTDPSPTGTTWTRRFNEANAIWGKLGVTFHDLGAVTIDTPLKTTGSTVAERNAVAALRSGAGIEVFLVDNDMAAMGGSSEQPGGPVAGCGADGNIVLSDRGTSNTILAHELGHTLGVAHPGGPSHAAEANTVMEPSGSNNTENPRRNTMGNFAQIQCPAGTGSTCLSPDP
jgi:outer membrane protein OmpA-like peptidoglycan-associated protein